MKKFILDLLKTKFEGVSEDVLEGMAAKLAKTATTEEQATTSVEGVTIQKIIESYAGRRATQSATTAVENYKKNNPQPKPNEPKEPQEPTDPREEVFNKLLERVEQLQGQMQAMSEEKVESGRRAQLNSLIEKLPASMQQVYSHINLKDMDDEKFETFKESVKTDVDSTLSMFKANGATIQTPYNNTGKDSKELTEEQIKAINNRGGVVNDGEQPF